MFICIIINGLNIIYYKVVDNLDNEFFVKVLNFYMEIKNEVLLIIVINGILFGISYLVGIKIEIILFEYNIWVKINYGSLGIWVLYEGFIILILIGNYVVFVKIIDEGGIEFVEI